ncbi:MAG: RecQ family ATP-dependent DNA helicase [Akkermansia sp.]
MMTPREETPDVQEVLQEHFGFASLRKGQDEVVEAIMEGRDALAIMPTGGGKSLCYQLPALCRPGLTVVVSPLIALMKDQVDALQERNIPAAAVNSSLGADEYRQVMGDLRAGRLKIIYVAPERFAQEGFMSLLRGMSISLLAIDEAHCLSQWGHDFRPDYLRLGRARAELGYPQTVALTATATDSVREDILRTLELRDPAVIISGFGRQNLDFSIVHCENRKAKFERIRSVMDKWGQGIIYCSTRKNVMAVYEEISGYGRQVVAYHAGMTDEEREFSQEAFISGRADVVVATNAFGMGIDRADVRFVVHFEIPGSVEAYYQEAGRAGRDGLPAVCELLFNHADLKTQEFFFEGSNPPLQTIGAVYNLLRREASPATHELQMTVDAMVEKLGKDVNPMAAGTALSLLMHAGAIERFDVPGRNVRGTRLLRPELRFEDLPLNLEALEDKAARDHRKIDAITRYAYCIGCRQQWILQYFGETDSEPCGHCDACREAEGNNYPPLAGEELIIVRKALSGVARACRHPAPGIWEGIYGRGKIMDMLRGSKSANMNRHLTGLSTYGILSQMTDTQMKALFRAMQEGTLLSTTGGEMPLISLSAKGEAVMMGREEARISRRGWAARDKKAARERAVQALSALANAKQDKELYARLAELRNDIAAETHMPVYRVLRNETMRAMAATKPTTMEAAERLKGVGPWLRTHFLRSFVELIRDYVES